MQIIISGAALQSAHLCAPKADIRYYLNNVYVEWTEKTTRVVSTNGHIMYLHDETPTDMNTGTGSLLIPRAVLDQFKPTAKGTFPHYVLTVEPLRVENERTIYTCSLRHIADTLTSTFTSGEGVFPDYTRVVPTFTPIDFVCVEGNYTSDSRTYQCDTFGMNPRITVDASLHDRFAETMATRETLANFDFDYLTLAMKVQKVLCGSKAKSPRLFQNGTNAGLIRFTDEAYMVIMPIRQDTGNPPLLDNFRSRIEVKEEKPLPTEENQEV